MGTPVRTRKRAACCAGALSLLVTAQLGGASGWAYAAGGSTSVMKDGSRLVVTAGTGKANEITVGRSASDFLVTDLGDTVHAGAGCVAAGANAAKCAAGGISRVVADGKDGQDTIDVGAADTPSTLLGGRGDDTLMGSNRDDRIEGGPGNDPMLNGDAGNDRIYGGDGDDGINAEDGDDYGEGGAGADILRGGDDAGGVVGADTLIGGPGRDTINGGPGNDRLQGNEGRDKLYGDPGDDDLIGGPGTDDLNGGDGVDRCREASDNKMMCEL